MKGAAAFRNPAPPSRPAPLVYIGGVPSGAVVAAEVAVVAGGCPTFTFCPAVSKPFSN